MTSILDMKPGPPDYWADIYNFFLPLKYFITNDRFDALMQHVDLNYLLNAMFWIFLLFAGGFIGFYKIFEVGCCIYILRHLTYFNMHVHLVSIVNYLQLLKIACESFLGFFVSRLLHAFFRFVLFLVFMTQGNGAARLISCLLMHLLPEHVYIRSLLLEAFQQSANIKQLLRSCFLLK